MSVQFVIDPLEFVRNTGIRYGKIPLLELERLHDLLFDKSGELAFSVCGQFDDNGRPSLRLKITGNMQLICHRCLDELTHHINLETLLVLAKNESELHQWDENDSVDAILATSELDIVGLIEDEVILSLSIALHHVDTECNMYKPPPIDDSTIDGSSTAHPFAALMSFKKNHN